MHDASVAARSGAMPRPLTPLVGRAADLATLCAWLTADGARLVTLTGPGGVGKTRLAVEVGAAVAPSFAGGTWFVPLAAIADDILVPSAIAHALGVREATSASLDDQLAELLGRDRQLLVLDNAEQVIGATGAIVARLLTCCANLTIVVTSRQRLAVPGEQEYPVAPLPVTGHPGSSAATVGDAGIPDAVRLFVQRARAVKPEFALTAQNAETLRRICARLDGLPLAIELAAARIRMLPPAALLERLEQRLPLLTGGGVHLPVRQQTMRQTVAWSYDLLTAPEQALFRRLAVFTGGFTLDATESVMAIPAPSDPRAPGEGEKPAPHHRSSITDHLSTFDGVASLVEKSLLSPIEAAGEPRFGMLETIRDIALERLDTSGEAPAARDRHLAYLLALAETRGPVAPAGQPSLRLDHLTSMAVFEREEDNLSAALEWAISSGDADSAHRLMAPLGGYWMIRGRPRERRDWSLRVLATRNDAEPSLRTKTLVGLGWAAFSLSDDEVAWSATEQGLAVSTERADDLGMAYALDLLGTMEMERGDHVRARTLLAAARAAGDRAGDPTMRAWILHHLGALALFEHALDVAGSLIEESVAIWRSLGDAFGLGPALFDLAFLATERGDARRAAELHREALRLWLEAGDELFIPSVLEEVAIQHALGADAAALLAAAARLRARSGMAPDQGYEANLARRRAALQAELGDEHWAAAWSAGDALSLVDAVALADAWLARATRADDDRAPNPFGLSPREAEVLKLVAAGLSNQEIAARLFISLPTVKVHVRAALTKLGVESRTAAAAFAIRNDLA